MISPNKPASKPNTSPKKPSASPNMRAATENQIGKVRIKIITTNAVDDEDWRAIVNFQKTNAIIVQEKSRNGKTHLTLSL